MSKRRPPARSFRPLSERLEDRALLSNIVWVNRGSDGFEIFNNLQAPIIPGVTNAEAARRVVDAAIVSWERVIENFNQLQEIGQPERNRIDLTLSINPTGASNGGGTPGVFPTDGILHPIWHHFHRPGHGFQRRWPGGRRRWFIDPTPLDHSEFDGLITNAFAATAQQASPANGLVDLYSVVVHDLTHVVGIHPASIRMQNPDAGNVGDLVVLDLKQRGLLRTTIVHWGGEIGRLPATEGTLDDTAGRDHNGQGFSIWLAGAGIKGGQTHGQIDEFGHKAAVDVVTPNDFQAKILNQLGLDHARLVYHASGRAQSLTDGKAARVIGEIIS